MSARRLPTERVRTAMPPLSEQFHAAAMDLAQQINRGDFEGTTRDQRHALRGLAQQLMSWSDVAYAAEQPAPRPPSLRERLRRAWLWVAR